MTISRVLILFTILLLFFVNASAQCRFTSQKLIQEPVGLFPNEMNGFKFFGEGKLSSLRLGVSTREEVAKILGEPTEIINNEEVFEDDPDWTIRIIYFDQKYSGMSVSSLNNPISRIWRAAPEYIGKMEMVRLRAKRKIPFNQTPDPDKFGNQTTRDLFNYTMHQDAYGLRYKVFESFLDKKQESKYLYSKGDIMQIEYHIECPIERKFFIEKKSVTEEENKMAKTTNQRF